ncbi:UNVERIFIED_CONTAM: hypothetical protein FKN15_016734 [Acipenser sinensis]
MTRLLEGNDIVHYLATFKQLATACGWPQKQWAPRLAGLLTGKARQAYATVPIMECQDYSQVKAAILTKYEINAESYHHRFQEAQVKKGDTLKELYTRLHEILEKWLKQGEQPIDVIVEQLLMEQSLRVCNPEVRTWTRGHNPTTAMEAYKWMETFLVNVPAV